MDEGIHTIEPFYIKTQEGQDNMDYEKFLLAIQIGQRRVQPIDLKGKSILLKERDWSFKRLERNQIEVTVWIDEKIDYTALNLTSLNYNQKHIFKIVKSLDRWYVMHHEYEDEFKMLFNTYRNLDYKTMKEEYLRQVKEQIKAQGIVDEEQLNLYRVEDKGKKYHREKATSYAKKYAINPNSPPWGNYERLGGDCTNFVSQCLFAGEIPFDTTGKSELEKWYWYSENNRVPTWTSANFFKDYLLINKKGGIRAYLSTFDKMLKGDIVQLGDEMHTRHSMIVVDDIKDAEGNRVDLVIAQHSISEEGRGYNIPLSTKPIDRLYWHIEGTYE